MADRAVSERVGRWVGWKAVATVVRRVWKGCWWVVALVVSRVDQWVSAGKTWERGWKEGCVRGFL